jgi:hypothetical protein
MVVDGIMIGSGDLRLDLGLPPALDGPEPEYNHCLDLVHAAAKKYNIPLLGFTVGPGLLKKRYLQGWRGFMCSADYYAAAIMMANFLKGAREEVIEAEKELGLDANGEPKKVNGESKTIEVKA